MVGGATTGYMRFLHVPSMQSVLETSSLTELKEALLKGKGFYSQPLTGITVTEGDVAKTALEMLAKLVTALKTPGWLYVERQTVECLKRYFDQFMIKNERVMMSDEMLAVMEAVTPTEGFNGILRVWLEKNTQSVLTFETLAVPVTPDEKGNFVICSKATQVQTEPVVVIGKKGVKPL